MKSRQFIWMLLFSIALNLNSFALTKACDMSSVASKKVFVLIRSEQNQNQLQKFKQQINKDLMFQNIAVEIETYKRSEPLPQAKIFKTAYSGDYDVLLLIEQVAKYTIDNRVTNSIVKMGGKYKIRSYNLKETPYTWVDHGDSNCNISVDLSLKSFTQKILATIDIRPSSLLKTQSDNEATNLNSNQNSKAVNNDLRLYKNLIEDLNTQKNRTRLLLHKIQELEIKLNIKSDSARNFTQLETN